MDLDKAMDALQEALQDLVCSDQGTVETVIERAEDALETYKKEQREARVLAKVRKMAAQYERKPIWELEAG